MRKERDATGRKRKKRDTTDMKRKKKIKQQIGKEGNRYETYKQGKTEHPYRHGRQRKENKRAQTSRDTKWEKMHEKLVKRGRQAWMGSETERHRGRHKGRGGRVGRFALSPRGRRCLRNC